MNLKKMYNQALFYYMQNRKKIDIALQSLNIIQHFSKKHYINGIKGMHDLSHSVAREFYYATDMLHPNNGWCPIFAPNEVSIIDIFDLSKYPSRKVKLQGTISFYKISDNIEIASHKAQYVYDQVNNLFFNQDCTTREEIVNILSRELFNSLQTNCVMLNCTKEGNYHEDRHNKLNLNPYELPNFPSEISNQLGKYLEKSMSLNVPRSVMLYSEPGTGKSCIAASALRQLNLRTLKIDNFNAINNAVILLIIKWLKIEAILIDDLDHMHIDNNSAVLDFLEKVRKQVKVVIATVNSTKPFHKAVLRPGRFDKIIAVHSLDEKVIKGVLGERLVPYFDKVKDWPIAFINELAISSQLEDATVDEIIAKLQKRVGANNVDTIDLDGKPVVAAASSAAAAQEIKTTEEALAAATSTLNNIVHLKMEMEELEKIATKEANS